MADEDDAGTLGSRREQRVDHLVRPRDRQRDVGADVARARAVAEPLPGEVAGAVLERRWPAPRRRAARSSERAARFTPVVAFATKARSSAAAPTYSASATARLQELRQAAREELDRLALELALPGLVALEHRPRAGAERAVVEEVTSGSRRNSSRSSAADGTRAVCRLPGRCVGSRGVNDGVTATAGNDTEAERTAPPARPLAACGEKLRAPAARCRRPRRARARGRRREAAVASRSTRSTSST